MNKKLLKTIIISLIISMTFIFNIHYFVLPIDFAVFRRVNVILGTLVFIFSFYFYYNNDISINKIKKIVSFIIGIILLVGEVYNGYHTYSIITCNIITFLVSILKIFGYYYLVVLLYYFIDYYLNNIKKVRHFKINNKYLNKFINYFDKYPFRCSFITIFIVFSIYLIAFYPGVLSPDPYFQLRQYFNVPNKYIDWVIQRDPNVFMSTHHPVFHTYLLGFCVSIGRFLINDNFGFFIYTFIQTIFYISVLSYTIYFLKKHKVNKIYRFIILLIYLIVPCYGFYTVSLVKDVYYTGFIILYVLFIYDLINNNSKILKLKDIIIFIIIMLGACLFRHNGIIVVGITTFMVILYCKRNRIQLISSFLVFGILLFSFNNILVPSLGISKGSSREMFSVLFQQTARYTKLYHNELSKSDKIKIDKVIGYKDLGKRYNEELADPVKNGFNKYTTDEDFINYLKVWENGLEKHPGVYIDSFINNTYGYFYPNKHNWYLYSNNFIKEDDEVIYNHSFNRLSILRGILVGYGNSFPFIPLIGLLVNIGFNTLLLIILGSYLISRKNIKYIIVLVPLFLSLGICLLSPANTYFRYAMPYIFTLPVLICLLRDKMKIVRRLQKEDN